MATCAERLEEALWKAARSGRRVADAEKKAGERGRGKEDTFLLMVWNEWKSDCEHVADLIKVLDETNELLGPFGVESMFGGRTWRRGD